MSQHILLAPLAVAALTAGTLVAVAAPAVQAATDGTGLVISEVYGGGGNSGATFTHDFVEIHNPTDEAISVDGMSLQYRSAGGSGAPSTGGITALTGSVPANGRFLVQQAQGNGGTEALPAPDVIGATAMGGSGGQIWLASSVEPITPPAGDVTGTPGIVDFVGVGADSFEGSGPATGMNNSTSVHRAASGADSDDNASDFTAAPPSPEGTGGGVTEPEPPEELDLTIPEIQGTGATSEYLDDIATTTGVVTAAYPEGGLFGFYLQTPGTGGATDLAERTASDGIFVRVTREGGDVTVQPDDHVQVTGTVAEYAGATQLTVSAPDDIVTLDEVVEPAEPVSLEEWPRTAAEREKLEGMLFQPTGDFTVTNTYFGGSAPGSSAYGEVGLAQGDTPLMTPTEVADAQDDAAIAAVEADNAARQIVLDDGSSWSFSGSNYDGQSHPPYVSQTDPVIVNAAVTFDEPVILTEGGSPSSPTWRFQPTAWVQGPDNANSPATFENTRTPAPDAAQIDPDGTADVTVAAFNVLNYFTTLGDADGDNVGENGCTAYTDRDGNGNNVSGGCDVRGAWDPQDLDRQESKIVEAVNALDADVVGLMEIENSAKLGEQADEATETLVAALNADAGDTVWAANPSSDELPSLEEQDVITNAIIYRVDSVERVGDAHALGDQSGEGGAFGNAREPIAQTFRSVDGGEPFLVVVNHFKSKGSGTDDGTGQGNANPDRLRQAEALRDWVPSIQAAEEVEAVLLAGDFNSYSMEDPLQVLYDEGYVNAAAEFGTGDEWSYSYSAMSGSLDHVLLNEAAQEAATGADIWGMNAGESLLFEYSRWNYHATDFHEDTPYRSSDHDPVLVGLDLDADDTEEPAEPQKATIKVRLKPAKVKVGKRTQVVVKVRAKKGVKATGKVTVTVKGRTYTAKLKKSGKAMIKLRAFKKPGRFKVVVRYLGSAEVKAKKKVVEVKVVRRR